MEQNRDHGRATFPKYRDNKKKLYRDKKPVNGNNSLRGLVNINTFICKKKQTYIKGQVKKHLNDKIR